MPIATIIQPSMLLCYFMCLVLMSCVDSAVPLSSSLDSPPTTANLVDLLRMANFGDTQFENFDKRRSRELFGKRSLGVDGGGYERSSRRSHELFGKRSDPVMMQEEQENEQPIIDKLREASAFLNQEENSRDGNALNFLVFSGYPSHFPNSKLLINKLQQRIMASSPVNTVEELQPKVVLKRRNRELFGKRSTIAPGAPLEELSDIDESQLNALLSFLSVANKHQQTRQRRARRGELFGRRR
uniref:Uncharacterized protein n=1 Tax=Ditylenchus dipsaci TaxID=166011 RepID=A0A915E5G2_9BILA